MKKNDVIQLIFILFPEWNHYDMTGEDDNFYFGEYGQDRMRHTDALYVIRFSNPSWMKEIIQLTIFDDGINCWKDSINVPLPNQFKALNFLKQFFPEMI